eukprot:COSAG06_NODE_40173_length_404_cov_1.396721_1_plen_40_part_10
MYVLNILHYEEEEGEIHYQLCYTSGLHHNLTMCILLSLVG